MGDLNQIMERYCDLFFWDLVLINFHHEEMYIYVIDHLVKEVEL